MQHTDILDFWFDELTHEQRFSGGTAIDERISEQFSAVHQAVAANECSAWREHDAGALAEIIVLDQFSRNLYRADAKAFAFDGQALTLAQVAVAHGFDMSLPEEQRMFVYMPYMHSESLAIHQMAVPLFEQLGNEEALQYEHIHKDIIDQFGRYPHRNEQLGRTSTPKEVAYLQDTEHAFFAS